MFCVLCRRLFWRDPKPGGRLKSRSRTRAVRRAADQARSSVRALKSNGTRDQGWQSLKCCRDVFEIRSQDIRRCRWLLHGIGSGLLAQQHGCSEGDLLEDLCRQDLCYWLGCVDLFLGRNHDLEVLAVGFIVGHE